MFHTCCTSYETEKRYNTCALLSFSPNCGEKRIVGPRGMPKLTVGPRYCEVAFHPKPSVVPRPPYNSAPTAKFSRQKKHVFPREIRLNGRLAPSAKPNSHGSLSFRSFSAMKFSEKFQPRV